ncbi:MULTISPECIES: L-threonylcarbamoyladenylate synthase [unclassified Streptococcus]|uniref:L-threonylcarbamoyladenylate synthase n=1 Tax=unclassified Streptococcus TaxID=2608887 RepID=UPI001071F505|nr:MULTISPECIES: L-threonylcarbamoyladenylate synthase [unclassified Streptococcus]MBF0788275.1 threonylcarbamoyl-AMP synthase [Streptococcus sp. 19428wC2_LYSM12]MCQ9212573.1 L-threonylcarbamoyladenylate synthase [Streptococcus sp. B01]MCQ9213912.1 L-threonylcarbamoyladenylate synthase [Streptococcus sp. O1]TFV04650.1 threonylcarbamoyl-AMP synthase [Streptococcus sp. LYSM12]
MDRIAKRLETGGAVILPTETVYGLFGRALDEQAVRHIYELKQRPLDKAMNLNVASLEDILAFSKNQPACLTKLFQAFLPGPLTIILQANEQVPHWINSGMKTIGFRVPRHPVTLDLIQTFGPLIGPSANLSGKISGVLFDQIIQDFHGEVIGVKDDDFLTGQDSTILDLSGEEVQILRQGAITCEDLLAQLPELKFKGEHA